MPLLSEIPWQPARPKRRWAPWAIVLAAVFIGALALFSRGVLPEPEVRLAKPSAVTTTSTIDPGPRDASPQIATPDERPPVRDSHSGRFPAAGPSTYDGLRQELLAAP